MKKFTKRDFLIFGCCIVLVVFAMAYNQKIQAENAIYFPRPLSDDDIKTYSNTDPNAVIIYPIFTQKAYEKGGFYDYYNGTCQTCNVVSIKDLKIQPNYTSSINSWQYLGQLHYQIITDETVDKHPEILNDYDKIILMHNEYMTETEFNVIKNHKNVIYLYPNAAYAEVKVDYQNGIMSLVKGHGYPEKGIGNGFGYETSSKHEYDLNCKNYKWEARSNGIQPTCWPEFLIKSNRSLLQVIKDYPQQVPPLVESDNHLVNITSLPKCDYYGNCK